MNKALPVSDVHVVCDLGFSSFSQPRCVHLCQRHGVGKCGGICVSDFLCVMYIMGIAVWI